MQEDDPIKKQSHNTTPQKSEESTNPFNTYEDQLKILNQSQVEPNKLNFCNHDKVRDIKFRHKPNDSIILSCDAESTPRATILDCRLLSLDQNTTIGNNRDLEVVNNRSLTDEKAIPAPVLQSARQQAPRQVIV